MSAKNDFPERLKKLREAIGVSQEEFAKALGVSRSTVGYYEKGDRTPDIEMLDRINNLTGCSIEYLMGYVDTMKPGNEEIGFITNLSDDAINVLRRGVGHAEVINHLIEHKDFFKLIHAIDSYSLYFTSEYSIGTHYDEKRYARYCILRSIEKIADDYVVEHVPREYIVDMADFYDIEPMKAAHEKYDMTLDEYNEAISLGEQQNQRRRKAHEEKIDSDPFYRFRDIMLDGEMEITLGGEVEYEQAPNED